MLLEIYASLAVLGPWLLGGWISAHTAQCFYSQKGITLIFAGVGGFLGYLILAGAIYVADRFNVPVFTQNVLNIFSLASFAVSAWLTFYFFCNIKSKFPSLMTGSCIAVLAIFFVSNIYMHLLIPGQGWDLHGPWGRNSHAFIEHATSSPDGGFSLDFKKHPITLYLIMAWSAWGNSFGAYGFGSLLPWFACFLSICFIIFGYVWYFTRALYIATIAILMIIAMPLMENHIILAGYAELFLSLSILGGVALISIAIERRALSLFLVGLFVSITAVWLKNTGLAYAILPLITWMYCAAPASANAKALFLVLSGALLLTAVWNLGFSFSIGGRLTAFDEVEKTLVFGGRVLELQLTGAVIYSETEITSRILNTSFGVLFTVFLVAWLAVFYQSERTSGIDRSFHYVLVSCTAVLVFLAFSLFTDAGIEHATPGADTGHSRFSLPAFVLVPLIFSHMAKSVGQRPIKFVPHPPINRNGNL